MGELVTDDVLELFAVVAEPEDLADGVAERFGGLVQRLSFSTPQSGDAARWKTAIERLQGV
jgi:hypothetical protein